MDGLGRAVGEGITGLWRIAFDVIGGTLRGMFAAAQSALPGGLLFVVVFFALVAVAWTFAKR